ncbi:EH signature domain-containing protein [Bordetella genomosp. 12]|uniref:Zorya protein ZorC EH domain-containing protein n=1 Tax=Bordetella genomosp. 12 TaxID=463035 RepID=A0A261VKY6_9BORD|nr:EH signature domain-containing protein [Bordetella genomosp. 12]OZI74250.1 hypothetical protein CAL22_07050 [Bordetella genomosp. 12]
MLAVSALQKLGEDLTSSIVAMGLLTGEFGQPALIENRARDAEQLFQGYAKARPRKEDAYAAARAFIRGQPLDAWQRDLVACAVAVPIHEQSGAMMLGTKRFPTLLASYEAEAEHGDLWRLTWHGLLYSYFNFNVEAGNDELTRTGWESLRAFLERTWPLINRQAGENLVPDWVHVLRKEAQVLTTEPVEKYASAYLRGETEPTERLAADLGIPPSSWFWHTLVLGAVKCALATGDAEFQRLVPQLIKLIASKPAFRDEALEAILIRYHACKSTPPNEHLSDFVCHPTVWKNPKLKVAGIAPAWNRVPDPVWRMVLNWVNKRNLKDFFDILAARNSADEGRLAFWSKYLNQIQWTRLVFGSDTMALKCTNAGIRDLIAREEGAYAKLSGKAEVDAFIMQIGSYLIIEFSKKPNACYVYQADRLPFERLAGHYDGGTIDLAAGFRPEVGCALRIVHRDGWDDRAETELQQLGIWPDERPPRQPPPFPPSVGAAASTRTSGSTSSGSRTSTPANGPNMASLNALVRRFPGAHIDDRREAKGGRLWVEDRNHSGLLETELKALGFKWAKSRLAWYYPEN